MKNKLLATSVLAGLGLATLAPAGASADVVANQNVEVELNGYTYFQIRVWDQELEYVGVEDRKYVFDIRDQEVKLTARYLSDDGFKYGMIIEFKAAESDNANVDEAYLFIDGPFGRLEMGNTDPAGPNFLQDGGAVYDIVYANSDLFSEINLGMAPTGETFGENKDFTEIFGLGEKVAGDDGDLEGASQTLLGGFNDVTFDATKIVYITPTFYGFTAGVSWTPDQKHFGESRSCDNDDRQYENIIDFGLQYEVEVPEWDNFKFAMSATYEYADEAEKDDLEELQIFHIGANVKWNGFKLGAGYYNYFDSHLDQGQEDAGADSGQSFNVAAGYETGPWDFVLAFNHYDRDYNNVVGDLETWFFAGKLAYTVAPGFVVSTELAYFDAEIANGPIVDEKIHVTDKLVDLDLDNDNDSSNDVFGIDANQDDDTDDAAEGDVKNATGVDGDGNPIGGMTYTRVIIRDNAELVEDNDGFVWSLNTDIKF